MIISCTITDIGAGGILHHGVLTIQDSDMDMDMDMECGITGGIHTTMDQIIMILITTETIIELPT